MCEALLIAGIAAFSLWVVYLLLDYPVSREKTEHRYRDFWELELVTMRSGKQYMAVLGVDPESTTILYLFDKSTGKQSNNVFADIVLGLQLWAVGLYDLEKVNERVTLWKDL